MTRTLADYAKHDVGCCIGKPTEGCPLCGGKLKEVRQSANSMLNSYQFDAVKAGDYYCETCKGGEAQGTAFKYWWTSELGKRACTCGLDTLLLVDPVRSITLDEIRRLAFAVVNCHVLARRALHRTTSAYDREKWEHVVRLCEDAGARSQGVLRASLPTEMTEGAAAPPVPQEEEKDPVRSEWQPIETAPKDGTVILRPHIIWGPMDVYANRRTDVPWPWVNGDRTTGWPEEAFLPFWMPLPPPPVRSGAGQEQDNDHGAELIHQTIPDVARCYRQATEESSE